MHYFIYATKDTWISSGSDHIATVFTDANYGRDEIEENVGFIIASLTAFKSFR